MKDPKIARELTERHTAIYLERDSHRLLYEGDRPVLRTGINAQAGDVVQIGGVYTPPQLRGQGYARRAVAYHLDELRQKGVKEAVLFAASDKAAQAYRANLRDALRWWSMIHRRHCRRRSKEETAKMTFIRPEARAQLRNLRELLVALCLLLTGLRWALFGVGIWTITGWAVVVSAVLLAVVGAQRVRFRQGGGGPGVVQVVEGQISYFGPLTGGAIAVSELRRLTLDPTARPAHWLLEQPGQEAVAIPVNAAGSEALFDAFAALPGIKTRRMLNALQNLGTEGAAHPVVIWQHREEAAEGRWLH